jgi:hypothetical protein
MFRSFNSTVRTLLGTILAGAVVAGCGSVTVTTGPSSASTAAPSSSARASAGTTAGTSAGSSASPGALASGASPSADATQDISAGLAHYDAKLEALLPGTIGGIPLSKLSMPLSTYMASETCSTANPCGDKALYTPWLVGFGKTPDDATLAAATDLSQTEKIVVQAFKVAGVDGTKLSAAFGAQAQKAGWPVSLRKAGDRTVQELTDPARQNLDLLSIGWVYAKDDVMYVIITDDAALRLESLIKLP